MLLFILNQNGDTTMHIRKYPDPILKKKCARVEEVTAQDKKLIEDMFEIMYQNQGVGLTAPQVGVLKQIVVIDVGSGPRVLINPKIIKKEGKELSEEGCLSLPGISLKIKRAKEVEVEALDQSGRPLKIRAAGLLSHCLQQEIDHLQGILIIDKVSKIKQWKLKLLGKI